MDSFLLVVVDDDKRAFSVEGPMMDDRRWNSLVYNAQKEGRNVRCFDTRNSEEDVIKEMEETYKLKYVPSGTVL